MIFKAELVLHIKKVKKEFFLWDQECRKREDLSKFISRKIKTKGQYN